MLYPVRIYKSQKSLDNKTPDEILDGDELDKQYWESQGKGKAKKTVFRSYRQKQKPILNTTNNKFFTNT